MSQRTLSSLKEVIQLKYLSLIFFSILTFSFSSLTFVHETPSKDKSNSLFSKPSHESKHSQRLHANEVKQMVPNVCLVIEKKGINKFLNPI
jgi:hypothetical protein